MAYTVRDLLAQIYNATTNAIYVQLVAGTAAIGKLAANSGVDIGDVTLNTGSAIVGKVGVDQTTHGTTNRVISGGGINISQTPTITAGAYAAKDAVGGLLTFAAAARISTGKGVINTVTIIDDDDEKAALELWLFNQTFTATADNAAFDPADATMTNCVGVIPIAAADYYSANDNGAACVRGVGLQFQLAGTSLFGQLKCTGTPTYTATTDLTIVLAIEYLD